MPGAVELVHVDEALIVALKPAGLLAVPGRTEPDCLAARVQALHPDARIVHRLDMATSGLMLFARGATAQRRLGEAFAARAIDKRYAALVHGRLPASGTIDLPLGADWPNRPRQQVDAVHGKPSLTRYRTLGHDPATDVSHVELEPVTGRAHQLRVHLLAVGHPIVGDALYAPERIGPGTPRLMLHAERLGFAHPTTGEALCFEALAPFRDAISRTPPAPLDEAPARA